MMVFLQEWMGLPEIRELNNVSDFRYKHKTYFHTMQDRKITVYKV
jgi:hypothetical protein